MNFHDIRGPADSKQDNFSKLCTRLLLKMFPKAKPVDGRGGDEGLDTFIGDFGGEVEAFQHKYFLDRLRVPQRRQIERSLAQAAEHHDLRTWTLMLPMDLNPAEIRWFETLRQKYPRVPMDWWGNEKLQVLLVANPEIAEEFTAPPTVVTIVLKNSLSLEPGDDARVREALKSAIGISADVHSVDEVLQAAVRDVKERSKLRVLVWGPGSNGRQLYAKRVQIRDGLSNLGHVAHFSEDVWNAERLRQSGLNLKVAELVQAKAYDYIVCLMATPGSIAEVHDFANDQRLAAKMMICVDATHKDGYSAQGALRIFEGFNGKLDWFDSPSDIDRCHLSTRVLEQVDKVAESKQYLITNARGGS
jgi:hypothetical protein